MAGVDMSKPGHFEILKMRADFRQTDQLAIDQLAIE
jgi:hypothetical protein